MERKAITRYLNQRQHPRRYTPPRTPEQQHRQEQAFRRSYPLGRRSENLTRQRLETLFAQDAILAHCDTTLESRPQGKRVMLAGKPTVLPDFQITIADIGTLFLDIKSKQFHSYYHRDHAIQQFVNRDALEDYQACARWYHAPAFILVHLWPNAWEQRWEYAPHQRIHTGPKELHPDELEILLRRYPVDDWYYLLPVRLFLDSDIGRLGGNPNDHAPGFYLSLHYALTGPASGNLPPRDAWIQALRDEQRYLETWHALTTEHVPMLD